MKKFLQLILLLFLGSTSLFSQAPKKIHDLKSLTDSSGTVHLFYRIYVENEGTEYFTDNIYHFNTEAGTEKLFLEHFYDTRFGFDYQRYVNEYRFFDNDPFKHISIGSTGFEFGFIKRNNAEEFLGNYVFVEELETSSSDTSFVYVTFIGYGTIKSIDGGRTWPNEGVFYDDNVPDSVKLDFPLISISPYNDSLMFGAGSPLVRSIDAGLTFEILEINPSNRVIYYDSDSVHVYAISTENCSSGSNCHYLSKSSQMGAQGSWHKPQFFGTNKQISVHPSISGKLYIWGRDSIYVSEDYGESIESLIVIENEEITGVAAEGDELFITTTSSLYKLENDGLTTLRQILVSSENERNDIPSELTLHQNYPNPFNPTTNISFTLLERGFVSLKVYDILGREVANLVNEVKSIGTHSVNFDASFLSSGIYMYKLEVGQKVLSKRMTLIK